MNEKKSVTVQIYGNEYTLKGEADPHYIAELAKFVDAKMAEIGHKSSAPAAKVAILAAMNIADEYQRLEKAKIENLKLIETLEKNLLEMKRSSDGSLRHTMELKDQLDRYKEDAGEKTQFVEAASKSKAALEEALKKISELEPELSRVQDAAAALKNQAEKAQEMLDSESAKAGENLREINELKINLGETKAELGKTREDAERFKTQLESVQKELSLTQTAHMKSDKDAEQLLEELEKAQNGLKFTQAEMEKLRNTAEKTTGIEKTASTFSQPPSFPPHEKLQALFKKIDAILE
jgi:cell division protein ZapA (FtsZ GTPase activity inhibitor)